MISIAGRGWTQWLARSANRFLHAGFRFYSLRPFTSRCREVRTILIFYNNFEGLLVQLVGKCMVETLDCSLLLDI